MSSDYRAEVRALLERYLPHDTDPMITRAFIDDWLPRVYSAERAELQGATADRIALAFFGKDGSLLARIESPAKDSKRLRDFYDAWRDCRRQHGFSP